MWVPYGREIVSTLWQPLLRSWCVMPPAFLLQVLRFSQSLQMDLPALRSSCSIIMLVPAKKIVGSPDLKCHHAEVLPPGFYVFRWKAIEYPSGNMVRAICQHFVKFCYRRVCINCMFSVHLAFKSDSHLMNTVIVADGSMLHHWFGFFLFLQQHL